MYFRRLKYVVGHLVLVGVALSISLVVSYAAFQHNERTGVFPRSITVLTPLSAFEPGEVLSENGAHETVYVNWPGIAGNTAILSSPIELIWLTIRRLRKDTPVANAHT
jgi:hypothetical protein